jgi:hypothetical protein
VSTMGHEPVHTRRSEDCSGWPGPPMRRLLWDVRARFRGDGEP